MDIHSAFSPREAFVESSFSIVEKKPKGSASLAAVVSAFVPTWATGLLFVAIFVAIRHRYRNIYMPRTFMGTIPEKSRTPAPSGSAWFDWVRTMRDVPDKSVLYRQSLDSYLFLRFLRTVIFICLVGCALTWPVLMPVNATGGGTSTQLDSIGIGNVRDGRRLYAHALVAWVFFGFVMFTVARERLWLVGLRQAWTLSKPNAHRLSSRTVLYLSAPRDALEDANMHRFFGDAAVRIWPATKNEELEGLVAARNSKIEQLESAEMALIRKADEKGRSAAKRSGADTVNYNDLSDDVKASVRPNRHLKSGKKVDSIRWLREQVKETESDIDEARNANEIGHPQGAAAVFVEFKTQADAQRALQQVASANLLALTPRHTDIPPGDIIWKNLTIPPARRASQEGLALAIVIATIIFWSIPSAFVGLVSNIGYLADNVKWLGFLKRLPQPSSDIFKSFGAPTTTANELKVQRWFYVFQVTQVFLVTAVFSGAATVASQLVDRLKDPTSVPTLLARELPKSSNFYLTYFIIQGTTSAADNLLNYSDLLTYLAYDRLFDKTPRQKFNRFTSMKGIAWGKVFPKFANFAIIVMGFAAIGLSLYYFSYRYNLLFVIQPKVDTKGQAYTLALQQLLTGVYIAELALIGIFGLRKATGPSVLLAVLFIGTIVYNALMNKYLAPLEQYLPAELRARPPSRRTSSASASAPTCPQVVDPIARFFEPRISTSYRALKKWLAEGDPSYDDDDGGAAAAIAMDYSEEDLRRAYLNPALTSPTPVLWLAKDRIGATANEIRESEGKGLGATDQGAWLDDRGRVRWSVDDVREVPIWKEKRPPSTVYPILELHDIQAVFLVSRDFFHGKQAEGTWHSLVYWPRFRWALGPCTKPPADPGITVFVRFANSSRALHNIPHSIASGVRVRVTPCTDVKPLGSQPPKVYAGPPSLRRAAREGGDEALQVGELRARCGSDPGCRVPPCT
ncbi:uncharacterized protein PG998_011707 [Apiospora kogelbergensis]|uniref:uncharacterized protein n=1 Tax=Apiospora kogelbergensis TaxID=1337665 RepID=UPI00312D96CE